MNASSLSEHSLVSTAEGPFSPGEASNQDYKELQAEITEATIKLLRGESHGHAGKYGYFNGGALLFSKFIENNPNYQLYWSEKSLLEDEGINIAQKIFRDTERVVIVGQGSAFSEKEWHIVKHLPNLKEIEFIDLSQKFNDAAVADATLLKTTLPANISIHISIRSQTVDYKKLAYQPPEEINPNHLVTTVICTGGLITNQDAPANGRYPESAVKDDLRNMARLTGGKGHLIIGYDTNDEILKLHAAYKTPELETFYYNCLEFMLSHSKGVELKDGAGNPITLDKAGLRKIFTFETAERFDQQVRNYPHMMKAAVPFTAYINHGNIREKISVEAGSEFVLMNCYKPRPNRMTTLAEDSAEGASFSIRSNTGYLKNGIMVQLFDINPRVPALTP